LTKYYFCSRSPTTTQFLTESSEAAVREGDIL
jgi:hypothetical protein